MVHVNLALTDEEKSYVETAARLRGHESSEAFIRALIDEDRRRDRLAELEASLVMARREPAREMTDQEWQELRQRAQGQLRLSTGTF